MSRQSSTDEKNTDSKLSSDVIMAFLMQTTPETDDTGVWVWNEESSCPEFLYDPNLLPSNDAFFSTITSYQKIVGFELLTISSNIVGNNSKSLLLKDGDWNKIFRFSEHFPVQVFYSLSVFPPLSHAEIQALRILDNLIPNTRWSWNKQYQCPHYQSNSPLTDEYMRSIDIQLKIVKAITGCQVGLVQSSNSKSMLLLQNGNWEKLTEKYSSALQVSYSPTLS